ncbi:serine hydrolase domain-containing protein [Mesobacillus zeae]|uniref:Class A beta-lactamase-related serine hydrolase n=1 Tax=Mesobacillus zeae TaxID=1917180 RepID=A0A398AWX4_9BACI|nr:serine hydrolase domain-containing protein [Mesobacillus zeae]RID81544.1 class A beta-lactamase-related serine hydrolase [Mesobacillus zeae]
MKNKPLSIALLTVMSFGVVFQSTAAQLPSIEKHEKKFKGMEAHLSFSWDKPGPSSPILHRGSARGAGMVQGSLDEIDGSMDKFISDGVMPGAVVFVARRGNIVKQDAYGYAYKYEDDQMKESATPVKMQHDTIFDLASISKIFTTTAIMKLYDQGFFKLDDPVAKYIPEFAQNGKENVTIRQLLTHTSGFPAWISLYTMGKNREDRMGIVFKEPLKNHPGSTYTYSDLNMITLGALIELFSGVRQDVFVKEQITEPLKMNDTMYNPPESLKDRVVATEYQPWTNRGIVRGEVHDENAWAMDGVAGHAGVFSTAGDLAKLAHMYLNDGRYGSVRILESETVRMLVRNQIPEFPGNDHGLGWELGQSWFMDALSEGSTLGHTGYTGTSIVVNRNNDTIAILLTNRLHPTRKTVSTNIARRDFARKVADSIPVSIPDKGTAWFSGYGDRLARTLTASVSLQKPAVLSFDTWYRMEAQADFGAVEVSEDGEKWTGASYMLTGSSIGWENIKIPIPANTKHIRFNYKTDSSANGRGWYLDHMLLKEEGGKFTVPKFTGEDWKQREY